MQNLFILSKLFYNEQLKTNIFFFQGAKLAAFNNSSTLQNKILNKLVIFYKKLLL